MTPANKSAAILSSEYEVSNNEQLLDQQFVFPSGAQPFGELLLNWVPFSEPITCLEEFDRRRDNLQSFQRQLSAGLEIVPAEGNLSLAYLYAKRLLDILGSTALIILFSPIMLTTLVVLACTTGGKPLFIQKRLGYRGRPFSMLKFRTMIDDAESRRHEVQNEHDGPIFKNRSDSRVTRVGRVLRVTSIDEMPQLFNILVGQMALVGPRPPIGAEVANYKPWQRRRLAVKPGLTCLWQVSGRSNIGFEEWVAMDLWYVEHQNLINDFRLLLQTPWSVISRRGAY